MPHVPPLRVWLLAVLLTPCAILLLILWRDGRTPPEQEAANIAAAYASELLDAPRVPGDIRVLGMGSSLLMAATPPANQTGKHLHWNRLTNPGLGMDFLGASLIQVEQNPPDILVIEKNLLQVDPQSKTMPRLRVKVTQGLKKIVAGTMPSMIMADPAGTDLEWENGSLSCAQLVNPENAVDYKKNINFLNTSYRSLQIDTSLLSALQRLSKRGVTIVIVDIQRSMPIEQLTATAKQAWFARLRQLLPPGARIAYWTSPSYDSGALYCDGSHLSPAGQHQFATWWYPQLAQLQKAFP